VNFGPPSGPVSGAPLAIISPYTGIGGLTFTVPSGFAQVILPAVSGFNIGGTPSVFRITQGFGGPVDPPYTSAVSFNNNFTIKYGTATIVIDKLSNEQDTASISNGSGIAIANNSPIAFGTKKMFSIEMRTASSNGVNRVGIVSYMNPIANNTTSINYIGYNATTAGFRDNGSTAYSMIADVTSLTPFQADRSVIDVAVDYTAINPKIWYRVGGGLWQGEDPPLNGLSAPTLSQAVGGSQSITLTWVNPTSMGSSAISNYEYSTDIYTYKTLNTAGNTAIITTPSNSTSTFTGGVAQTIYVRAVNAGGPGPASGSLTATPYTLPTAQLIGVVNKGTSFEFSGGATGTSLTILDHEYTSDGGTNWKSLNAGPAANFNTDISVTNFYIPSI
jgi:hypothetical protein